MTLYNRTKSKTKKFADQSARAADSPKVLAVERDVIISMISEDPALEVVCIVSDGAFQGAQAEAVALTGEDPLQVALEKDGAEVHAAI